MNLRLSMPRLKNLLPAIGLFAFGLCQAQALPANLKSYQASGLLKNYALSVCVQHASAESPIGNDARASAAAYVEFGEVNDSDAYAEISKMAKEWLKKDYPSKTGASLNVMKCIDFFHSKQLAQKVTQFTKGVSKR